VSELVRGQRKGESMICKTEIDYEVRCDDECIAITSGENALEEAWHYASVYERDGDVTIYKVTKLYEPID